MKMDVRATIGRTAAILLGIVVVLIIFCLAWIGGELHYNNCLEQAQIEGKSVSCSRLP